MARIEEDKEDLIADGVAMINRAEYSWQKKPATAAWDTVTVGYRADGSCSLYFNQDPFYQVDGAGRLRRAFVDGFLFRSDGATLNRLHRQRTAEQTTLLREDLTERELTEFQMVMKQHVRDFLDAVKAESMQIQRCVFQNPETPHQLPNTLTLILSHGADFFFPRVAHQNR